jgi:hypothetical protein
VQTEIKIPNMSRDTFNHDISEVTSKDVILIRFYLTLGLHFMFDLHML